MSRLPLVSLLAWGLLGLCAAISGRALADTIVAGTVNDVTSDAPVIGASVTVRHGNTSLGSATTDGQGSFRLPFDLAVRPEAQHLKLVVNADGYVEDGPDVIVTSGRADPGSFRIRLLPRAIADCVRTRDHSVVVGYFRPPASGANDANLAARIAEALNADLLPRIQQARVGQDARPVIRACGKAQPQGVGDSTNFAKVLHADAFITGYVDDANFARTRKVKVQMAVADRFDVFVPPLAASSPDVNLNDPSVARLDVSAHAAILSALIIGYERGRRYDDCIEIAVAAERIIGRLPPVLLESRRRCEAASTYRGLLP